jgi:hypothetical protein
MNQLKKILVIGATGMLAKPVILELLKAGFQVSGLVRNLKKAHAELPEAVKLLEADLQNPTMVEKAMEGQEAIYINLSVKQNEKEKDFHSEGQGLATVLASAQKTGIQRIAYISSLVKNYQGMNGFDWWAFRLKNQAVTNIQACGIPYTIFYPSTFMETLPYLYRQGNRLLLAGKGLYPMYFIAGEDYGRQVAQSFKLLGQENREYAIQGLDAFTAEEACELFKKTYTRAKLSINWMPIGVLKFLGMFSAPMNYGYHILTALNKYPEKFAAETTWEELGKPEITLLKYIQSLG